MSLIFHTSVVIFAQATLATRAGTVSAHSYMPPKGSKKTSAKLGSVVPHGNGFRVQANIERHGSSVQRRTQTAPYRTTLAKANEDLRRVQSARTLEEYGHILEQLWQEAEACRSGDGSGVVTSSGPAAAIADGQEEAARQDEAKWVPQVIVESHTMAPKQKPLHELGALAPHGVKWLPASMADSVRRQSKWRRANGGQKPMHTSCMAKPVESGGGTGVPHSAAGAKPGMALKKPVSELGTVVADVADGNQRAKRKRDIAYDEFQGLTADLFQWLLSHKRGESGPKESDGNQRAERKSPLKPMMTEREVEAEIASDCHNSGTLTELRGINIQQPWARLILDGCKTIEARKYPLRGYLNELLWVIEASGTCKRTIEMDRPTGLQPEQLLGRRHRRVRAPAFSSKIIGVVRFGSDHEYTDVQQWRSDEKRHCITECSQFDWNGAESEVPKMYGWHVESAHYLTEPQRAPVIKGMIGCKAIKRYGCLAASGQHSATGH